MKKPLSDLAKLRRLAKRFESEGKPSKHLIAFYEKLGEHGAAAHLLAKAETARENARLVTLAADALKVAQKDRASV